MTEQPENEDEQSTSGVAASDGDRVVVVTPGGMGVAEHGSGERERDDSERRGPTDLVEQPAKVAELLPAFVHGN